MPDRSPDQTDGPARPVRRDGPRGAGPRWGAVSASFEMAGAVAGGCLLGWLIDEWRGSEPWGLLVGGVVGMLIGMWTLIRLAFRPPGGPGGA
ncbi:MAG: AtpZ/AtpI family protein [Planctomycetota bacterium]